jgi:hypothetical protein
MCLDSRGWMRAISATPYYPLDREYSVTPEPLNSGSVWGGATHGSRSTRTRMVRRVTAFWSGGRPCRRLRPGRSAWRRWTGLARALGRTGAEERRDGRARNHLWNVGCDLGGEGVSGPVGGGDGGNETITTITDATPLAERDGGRATGDVLLQRSTSTWSVSASLAPFVLAARNPTTRAHAHGTGGLPTWGGGVREPWAGATSGATRRSARGFLGVSQSTRLLGRTDGEAQRLR